MSDALEQITTLGKLLHDYKRKIKAHEDAILILNAAVNKLKFKELPSLFEKLGNLTELKVELDGGVEVMVSLDRTIHAGLSKGNKTVVFDWMNKNGYAHHISTDVNVPFTKGQEEELKQFVDYLDAAEKTVDYSVDNAVHSSTYSAFVKGIIAEGYHIDDEEFGVYRQEAVDIHPVKETKKKGRK